MALKRSASPSCRQQQLGKRLELVGADGEPRAGSEQLVEQLGHPFEGSAADGDIVRIEREERIVQPSALGFAYALAAEAQAGLDHRHRSAADEGMQLADGHRFQPDQRQGMVGGGQEVGRRVDDGAVEVEDDGGIGEVEGHDNLQGP